MRVQNYPLTSTFTNVPIQIGPPFQGGGTGSNPVGGALKNHPKTLDWQGFWCHRDQPRVTTSNHETPLFPAQLMPN
jgi:hypothetical protein